MTDFTLDAEVHNRSTPANTDCPYKDRWTRQHEHLVRLFFSAPNQFGLHCRRLIYCFLLNSDSQLPISPVSSPSVCQCVCGRRGEGSLRSPRLCLTLSLCPQVHGLTEDMLEKLDLEDEGKPLREIYVSRVVIVTIFLRFLHRLLQQLRCLDIVMFFADLFSPHISRDTSLF